MKLRVLSAAEAEIAEAYHYLEMQSPGLGGRFLDDLVETLASVENQPLRFSRLETLSDDAPYRRALLKVFRYAVIFEIEAAEIIIVAVSHTSREPNYWLSRRPH